MRVHSFHFSRIKAPSQIFDWFLNASPQCLYYMLWTENRCYSITSILGEWPSGLRCIIRVGRFRFKPTNPPPPPPFPPHHQLGSRPGIGTQPLYECSWWTSDRNCKTQWLTSGEWGCPPDNGPELALGEPNSSKNKETPFNLTKLPILHSSRINIIRRVLQLQLQLQIVLSN